MNSFKSNCHTHTIYCDGKNTAEAMIKKAIELGFVSLGFSGHCPMNFSNDWAMTAEGLKMYCSEIESLKEKYKGKIDIILGLELDADYEFEEDHIFSYVISSVHQIHGNDRIYSIDYTAEELSCCVDNEYGGDWNKMAGEYFDEFADFVIREKTDVVGHFDLITKFNKDNVLFNEDNEEYKRYAINAVDKILSVKPSMIFEVNTGAMFRCGNEKPYPAPFILKRIGEKGGRITITSDAHQIDALDFAFEKAVKYCKNCGFDEVWYLTSEGFRSQKF